MTDIDTLFNQSKVTAEDYFLAAESFFHRVGITEQATILDTVEFAKVMAMDFRTMMISEKLEEITNALQEIKGC
jgi:hypothetical protein